MTVVQQQDNRSPARRRTDQLALCCKSLFWAVLPFVARGLAQLLSEWAARHQHSG